MAGRMRSNEFLVKIQPSLLGSSSYGLMLKVMQMTVSIKNILCWENSMKKNSKVKHQHANYHYSDLRNYKKQIIFPAKGEVVKKNNKRTECL